MATLTQPTAARTTAVRPGRWVGGYAGGLVAAVLPYALGVLLPYYVNDLHRLPLSEVASGRYDPKTMWPAYTGCGGLVDVVGLLSLAWTPLALAGLTVLGPVLAWRLRLRAPWASVAVLVFWVGCVAAVGWALGPTGAALATWRMD